MILTKYLVDILMLECPNQVDAIEIRFFFPRIFFFWIIDPFEEVLKLNR